MSIRDREEWLDILFKAIQDYFIRQQTLQKADVVECVGIDPPIMQEPNSVRSCSSDDCFVTFGIFTRGHNCRACGKVYIPDIIQSIRVTRGIIHVANISNIKRFNDSLAILGIL